MKKILTVTLFSALILGTSGVTSFAAEIQQDQPRYDMSRLNLPIRQIHLFHRRGS